MRTRIGEIAVVMPSRNEARLLPRALSALDVAMSALAAVAPHVPVTLTVVLDCTSDNSAQILAGHSKVRVTRVSVGRAGTARNAGITASMARSHVPPEQLWIANTDADSIVPADWLIHHHAHALAGAHVLAGTVEPVPTDLSSATLSQWFALHDLREGHSHVHGANLGIRSDVYTSLGGFSDQGLHEDRDFVAQARASGYTIIATDSCRVSTSGRLRGRIDGGFAHFLAQLDDQGKHAGPSATSSTVG